MNITLGKTPGKELLKVFVENGEDYKRQRMPEVGARRCYSDGSEYVFCQIAVDGVAGQVVSAPAAAAELAGKFTAALAGEETVTLTDASLSAVTANLYAGGTLVVTESSGVEAAYKIRGNSAAASNAVVLTLDEALLADIAAADDCIIVPPRYENVVIGTATSDGVGVLVAPSTAGTSGLLNFLWVQTKGVASVKVGTAAALTKGVKVILGAAGVIEAQGTAGVQQEFGFIVAAGAVTNGDTTAARVCFE